MNEFAAAAWKDTHLVVRVAMVGAGFDSPSQRKAGIESGPPQTYFTTATN